MILAYPQPRSPEFPCGGFKGSLPPPQGALGAISGKEDVFGEPGPDGTYFSHQGALYSDGILQRSYPGLSGIILEIGP